MIEDFGWERKCILRGNDSSQVKFFGNNTEINSRLILHWVGLDDLYEPSNSMFMDSSVFLHN